MSFWSNYRRTPPQNNRTNPPSSLADGNDLEGGTYRFSGDRKDYFQFMEELQRRLAKEKIAYLFDENETRDIDTDPPQPTYEDLPEQPRPSERIKAKVTQSNVNLSKAQHTEMALKVKKGEEIKLHIPVLIAIIEEIPPVIIRGKINNLHI
jgi:hypothetical protein